MDEIRSGLRQIVFEGELFSSPIAYSYAYMSWESNNAMSKELARNISLAFVAIIVVTLVLIADLRVSGLVGVESCLGVSKRMYS